MLEDPRAAAVRTAAGLADARRRRRTGLFLAEGPQAVREALTWRPRLIREVYATSEALERHPELAGLAQRSGRHITLCSDRVIQALADTVTPQGVVAVCRQAPARLSEVFEGAPRLVAALSQARDPGNAGTIIRVADAAGADAVILTASSVDPYNPKAVRAATGSHFHLPIAVGAGLDRVFAAAAAAGLQVIAADISGGDLAQARRGGVLARPTLWLFGNEAHGLAAGDLAAADQVLRVPIYGRAESMNLATAAAVCLYASAFELHSDH